MAGAWLIASKPQARLDCDTPGLAGFSEVFPTQLSNFDHIALDPENFSTETLQVLVSDSFVALRPFFLSRTFPCHFTRLFLTRMPASVGH